MKLKRLALVTALMFMLMFVMAACGSGDKASPSPGGNSPSGGGNTDPTDPYPGTAGQAQYDKDGNRIIRIGTWYDMYFQSSDSGPEADDGNYVKTPEGTTAKYENMKAVEAKLKVKFEYVRMAFDGMSVSIEEGAMSGRPAVDIYQADLNFGVPAAIAGYAIPLDYLADANNDIFTTQQVLTYLELPGIEKPYLFTPYNPIQEIYALAFNWTLLKAKGLENPQDLWEKGEWTWEKFKEYCVALTDKSATPPTYGLDGWWTNHLEGLLRSNATAIAGGPKETLTDPKTGDVFTLFKELYVDLAAAKPWEDNGFDVDTFPDGTIGFWNTNLWMLQDRGGGTANPLTFQIGVVPYPVGPSGNKDTNFQKQVGGNWYFIPKGVEKPKEVYQAFFDYTNWYEGDYSNTEKYDRLSDDPADAPVAWEVDELTTAASGGTDSEELAQKSIDLWHYMNSKPTFDFFFPLQLDGVVSMVPIMSGEETPAQMQEEHKQEVQDKLDATFGN
ncbi:hypothetical protein FACS18949_03850 [Clostridia bacterium]|nr:hypothetical protein FACS18949_03850 [Clostridia bacterium]